jgi:protein gp37
MGSYTTISWTTRTQNFWEGCTWMSPGCDHCYMFRNLERFKKDPTQVRRTSAANWRKPYAWNREAAEQGTPQLVFTCSYSDFFHPDADSWRPEAWQVIRDTPFLHHQILTKRPGRIPYSLPPDWGDGYSNVWLGVSIESRAYLWRLRTLKTIPARIRFLSLEPLLEDLGRLDLSGIQWVIVGGESGPGFRPMDHQWARAIRAQCQAQGVAFFFKQSSALYPGQGDTLDGRQWQEYPALARGPGKAQRDLFAALDTTRA